MPLTDTDKALLQTIQDNGKPSSRPPTPYRLLSLTRDDQASATYLYPLLTRIRLMSHRMGGNPDTLLDEVWKLFAAKSPHLALWVALDAADTLIGHALAELKTWDNRYVLWINQVDMDVHAGRELRDLCLIVLENYVQHLNTLLPASTPKIKDIIMCTPRMNDGWARHTGFEPYRAIFRREVK